MKIAILAPSPVPFTVGGAERFVWGLLDHFNRATPHRAELIKLPLHESGFWQLVGSYRAFSRLDLDHFDLVVSTKYPSWMVHHRHHRVLMLHKLRGLYDTYPNPPADPADLHPAVSKVRELLHQPPNRESLAVLFDHLDRARRDRSLPLAALRFPGPLAREVVHFLDAVGLAPPAISGYAAISHNVRQRQDYFPAGSEVTVCHPPPAHRCPDSDGGQGYFLTLARFDNGKRVRLMAEAYRLASTELPFKIVGSGPQEAELRAMAAADPRLELLGAVAEAAVPALYAGALAVLYTPYDEDYGLVAAEALATGKPVITTADAGGPLELVEHGVNGLVAAPEATALAAEIDLLASTPELAAELGAAGLRVAAELTWERLTEDLLRTSPGASAAVQRQRRPKLTVATTYPIYPPRGGGQSRVFHLYRHLAEHWDIEVVSFTDHGEAAFAGPIAAGLREIRLPKSAVHEHRERLIAETLGGLPATDLLMPELWSLTPEYGERLRASGQDAEAVVACQPYLWPAIDGCLANKPLFYDSQNVEANLKAAVLPDNPLGQHWLAEVRRVEGECCRQALLTLVCSLDEGTEMATLYGLDADRFRLVANGTDLDSVTYVDLEERLLARLRGGLEDTFCALFMGSWHPPNLKALEVILALAESTPDICFLVMGSVGQAVRRDALPGNVALLGVVDNPTKDLLLGIADVALNPMSNGAGTNLKMLDYLAAGLPLLSTPFGARGLDLDPERHLWLADLDDLGEALAQLRSSSDEERAKRAAAGYQQVRQHYSWRSIAEHYHRALRLALGLAEESSSLPAAPIRTNSSRSTASANRRSSSAVR